MQGDGSLPHALLYPRPWTPTEPAVKEGMAQEVGSWPGSVRLSSARELKADGGSLKCSRGEGRGRVGSSATSLDWGGGVWIWKPAPKPSHQRVPAEWAEWLCALHFEGGGSVCSWPRFWEL